MRAELELRETGCGLAEQGGCGADVGGMHSGGGVPDKLHGHALGDAGSLQHGSDGGAEGMEGFAVPGAAGTGKPFAREADAVQADKGGEFVGGVGVAAEAGVYPDGGISALLLRLFVAGACPLAEGVLHGLVQFAGCFAGDDVDGAGVPVELFPAQVEDVAEALAVGADAAAHGG